MTILFTGHKGFLGRELIPSISSEENVITFDGDYTNQRTTREFIGDFRVTKIIHAAARGGRRTKSDTPEVLLNNLVSTLNVLDATLPTLMFCSGAIYNRDKSINQAKEELSNASYPSDFYGQSKYFNNLLAKKQNATRTLRFFNVFGKSEGLDRFISFNIHRYIQKEPMIIFKDFQMDFFYVLDVIPVMKLWLAGGILPKEINMVYEEKVYLSEICELINQLGEHKVPIEHKEHKSNLNYTGNSDALYSIKTPLMGLRKGLVDMYRHLKELEVTN